MDNMYLTFYDIEYLIIYSCLAALLIISLERRPNDKALVGGGAFPL